jgi:putative MFS transporter
MFHAYQAEVFPTSIRARAAGLAYSMRPLIATFSGFICPSREASAASM